MQNAKCQQQNVDQHVQYLNIFLNLWHGFVRSQQDFAITTLLKHTT